MPLEGPTRVRWTMVFPLAMAVSGVLYLHRYAWGIIKPDLKETYPGLGDTQLGWLDSAFLATYSLFQVPSGMLNDRFGIRTVLPLVILLWSASLAALAWAPGLIALAVGRALFGLAQAGGYPALNKLTRSWYPPQVRTSVQGAVTSMGRVGGALAGPVVGTLLLGALGLPWQTTLVVVAVPGVLLAVLVWVGLRDTPAEHPQANAAEVALIPTDAPNAAGTRAPSALRIARTARLTVAGLLGYIFFSTFADQFFVFWLPQFLREGKGLSPQSAGVLTMLPLLGGAVGGLVGGMLNDWLNLRIGRRWGRRTIAMIGKLLAAILVALCYVVGDAVLAVAALVACKFFGDWSLPSSWGAITDTAGRSAATLFGLVNTVGAAGGFVAGPILGRVKELAGWEGQFALVAIAFACSAACWLLIDSTRTLVGDEPTENPR